MRAMVIASAAVVMLAVREGRAQGPLGPRERIYNEVSTDLINWSDRVEVAPGQNDILILAITVCVDAMAHEGR